ncbi:YqcI/YcgG family protein [Bizionia gelidisalsuginis]|uniref:YqcI/YcgG family protein n=2 Tax=Bizionia TaxID=283785 RepID=A0A8H2QDR6_9FLAO|nr:MULTISPECIES: guanitoxin biosynthesis heme-dependent pre-guanitoxin N-hydroxylase GntA [Bizionia]TYB71520.1 YqcI/YcgG family protein [Bizionia saleffrena]TYC10760.1 YqcI/YcgG family protein [Bizionia gelidisalsuginis]
MADLGNVAHLSFQAIEDDYKNFVLKQKHPCVMAKTVFLMNNYHLKVYDSLNDNVCLKAVLNDLEAYINQYDFESNEFESFMAVFPNDHFTSELEFENKLWSVLQKLHDIDDCDWDPTVSSDPDSSEFSLSLKGKAFYIVGLHPNSSRIARQSPHTTIVFNLHWQFEKLREMGTYSKIKKRIRKRDQKLQGYINPVLKDFGNDTETKQYSGRAIESDWKCPFHTKK